VGAKTFGEGVAASTNENAPRQINSLYGQDVTSAIQIATGAQGAAMLGSALGVGRAAGKASTATSDAIKALANNKSLSAELPHFPDRDANFYREGAPPAIVQQTFNQAALSSTHNPDAVEVVLGKYIAGSPDSYDAVAGPGTQLTSRCQIGIKWKSS
jgi:hypothetical protein